MSRNEKESWFSASDVNSDIYAVCSYNLQTVWGVL